MQKDDLIAFLVSEMFLVLLDFKLVENRADYTQCYKDYGPHRVYTLCGRTLETVDTAALSVQLGRYLRLINKALGTRLNVYNLELYENPCGFGSSVYIGIYF